MRPIKQDITLAIDQYLLNRAQSSELRRIVETQEAYAQAKYRALAQLDRPFHLGARGVRNREDLHDRDELR